MAVKPLVPELSNETERMDAPTMPKHATLAEALAAFHSNRPDVIKDSENTHFNNKYASLNAFEAAVLPLLAAQGLTWVCIPSLRAESNDLMLEWQLIHSSGDLLSGYWPLVGGNSQATGSSLTYARRYLLSAVTGVSAEDDDNGEAASKAENRQQGEADWSTVLELAADALDLPALRRLYVTKRVGTAPADVQAAFTEYVNAFAEPKAEEPGSHA